MVFFILKYISTPELNAQLFKKFNPREEYVPSLQSNKAQIYLAEKCLSYLFCSNEFSNGEKEEGVGLKECTIFICGICLPVMSRIASFFNHL